MSRTDNLRGVLAGAAEQLRAVTGQPSHQRGEAYVAAGEYARGVLDAVAAVLADEDEPDVALSTERRRDPTTGRFVPSEAMQALRDGTEAAP